MKKLSISLITLMIICLLILVVKNSTRIFDSLFVSETDIISRVSSPDGEYVAYIFESSGGATSDFTYRLSIIEKGKELKSGDKGNTYVSNSEFVVEWEDNNTLVVNNSPEDEIYKQETKLKDINIKYNYIVDK